MSEAQKHQLVVFGSARVDAFMQLPPEQADQLCSLDDKLCVIQLAYSAKLPLKQVDFLTGGNGANVAIGSKRLALFCFCFWRWEAFDENE